MRITSGVLLLATLGACSATPQPRPPLTINSPQLDSGIRGNGGGGLGGEATVGRTTSGVINRVTVP